MKLLGGTKNFSGLNRISNFHFLKKSFLLLFVFLGIFQLLILSIPNCSVESYIVVQKIQRTAQRIEKRASGLSSFGGDPRCISHVENFCKNERNDVDNICKRRNGRFPELRASQNHQEISSAISPAIASENEDKEEISLSKSEISIESFQSVDIRSGIVLMADLVPDPKHDNKASRKYLKLLVDVGFERRQIVSGVRSLFDPEDILGKSLMVVVNTKKEEILGLESHGRILIANHYSKKPMPRSLRTILQKVGLPPGSSVEIA